MAHRDWRLPQDAGVAFDVLTAVQPTPSPTGNMSNLGAIFTDPNGDVWAVDKGGDAKLLHSTPPEFAQVVYVNSPNPNTATVFDASSNPPVVHDPALVHDSQNLYIGSDASTWVWKAAPANAYVSAPATAASPPAGTVLQSVMWRSSDFGLTFPTAAASSITLTVPQFLPLSTRSRISVQFDVDYFLQGFTVNDNWTAEMRSNGAFVASKVQRWDASVMAPIMDVQTNTSLSARNYTLRMARTGGSSLIIVRGHVNCVITEVQR